MFFNNKEFLKLQKEWDKKLKAEGFIDIEFRLPNGEISHLTKYAPGINGRKINEDDYRETFEFYNLARQILYEKDWENELERLIWSGFSEGKTYREIAKELPKKICLEKIFKIINKLKKEMLT